MLQKMLQVLVTLPPSVWDAYALCNEPLKGKLTGELGQRLLAKAHTCGAQLARETAARYPGCHCADILKAAGAQLEFLPHPNDGSYTMFACFTEPNTVSIYEQNLHDAHQALVEHHCADLLQGADLCEILLAHELFHWLEYRTPDIYTKQEVLTLWKLGCFFYKSRVLALGEVAAMSFTQTMLNLPYSPYVLDVVLLYQSNPQMALQICNHIFTLAGLDLLPPV